MGTEQRKGEVELAVFREFADRCPLTIDLQSIQKRSGESEPDILCQLSSGEVVAFELVEICDSTIASTLSRIQPDSPPSFWSADPTAAIVRKKLHKSYHTAHPVELLCYSNGRVITPDDGIREHLSRWADAIDGPFRRLWLLGEQVVYQVWDR